MSSLALIDWKNPLHVEKWKADFLERFKPGQKKPAGFQALELAPLLDNIPLAERVNSAELEPYNIALASGWLDEREETLTERLRRLEGRAKKPRKVSPEQAKHAVPRFVGKDSAGWCLAPVLKRQEKIKMEKSQGLWDGGLEAKAQRQAACGIIGGEVHCINGHTFLSPYECELRYCPDCGPKLANLLFAKNFDKLFFVAQRLMLCSDAENCSQCNDAIKDKKLPHWPPPTGSSPRIVCAKLDFTVRSEGDAMPPPERMRVLNSCIKKFCRLIEKRFHIRRTDYGLAYCDELGGNNNNPHAHGVYVGPWLPNSKKELATLWAQVTKKEFPGTFIISIKYARDFPTALYHAVKYPAKFAERAGAKRLVELEIIFHRVRRFHTLAAFYAPEVPEVEREPRRCPICKQPLSDWFKFEGVLEMRARGLRDVHTVALEVNRQEALSTGESPPPKNTVKCDRGFQIAAT